MNRYELRTGRVDLDHVEVAVGGAEPAVASQLDEELWKAWKERGQARDARRAAIFLKAGKVLSIAGLWIAAAGLLSGVALSDVVFRLSITGGSLVVMSRALRVRRFAYSALFGFLALLYNPVAPVFSFSGEWQRAVLAASALPFVASLAWANIRPASDV